MIDVHVHWYIFQNIFIKYVRSVILMTNLLVGDHMIVILDVDKGVLEGSDMPLGTISIDSM